MERAALYLRLSRQDEGVDEGGESESIENQRLLLREYAKAHGYEITEEYADEDISGLTDDRPGFRRMMRDARRGQFDVILAKSQSRFSRNMQHIERYLHRELPLLGIRFIGVVDGADTGSRANKKARQIYGLINEWYCEDLSDNVRAVLHRKVREGQFIGSFAPYGYRKDESDRHRLVPREDEAEIVRQIFQWYGEGCSIREICRRLDQRGVCPPGPAKQRERKKGSLPPKEEGGHRWNGVTVKRILTNEVYLGHMLQGKSTTGSYKDKTRRYIPKQEWIRQPHMHQAIVSEALFARVQERLDGKK